MSNRDINHEKKALERFMKELDDDIVKTSEELIENEINKDINEMDADLIDECVDNIIEIKGIKRLTPEETKQQIQKLYKVSEERKKRKRLYNIIRIPACILVAVLAFQVMPMVVFGVNPIDKLYRFIISNFTVGESMVQDGITYIPRQRNNI